MSSPMIKFEHSPAQSASDSFVSTPGTMYPPLFEDQVLFDQRSMSPMDVMTPRSFDGESAYGSPAALAQDKQDKKPIKKRKSWGQALPEPKTQLPPRKRAKTEDEKEQRRVERVLRNRKAAESSRRRKTQETQELLQERDELKKQNESLSARLEEIKHQLEAVQRALEAASSGNPSMGVFQGSQVSISISEASHLRGGFSEPPSRQHSPTLSHTLFGSDQMSTKQHLKMENPSSQTVNPASLSPELLPVVDYPNASSSDMTQHTADMLCDLPCQSEEQRPWDSTILRCISALASFLLTMATAFPDLLNMTGSPSKTTQSAILNLMMVLRTAPATCSTSATSSTSKTQSLPATTMARIQQLQSTLLSCSLSMARPVMDATLKAMRSASDQQLTIRSSSLSKVAPSVSSVEPSSREVLQVLSWAIEQFEQKRNRASLGPELDAAAVAEHGLESSGWQMKEKVLISTVC